MPESSRMHEPDIEAPLGLLRLDEGLAVRAASAWFLREFECSFAELEGVELTDFVAARDRPATLALDRCATNHSRAHVDILALLELGARERLTRLVLVRDADGWVASVEPLDGANNLVHDLLVRQRRTAAVIREASEGIVFLDGDLRIVEHNARFVELIGFRSAHGVLIVEEALAGRSFVELIAESESHALLRTDALWSPAGYRSELELDGRWLELETRPLYLPGAGRAGYSLSLRDRSDRRRAEQERSAREQEQLRHQAEIIAAQREAIRALTAPRIPISPEVTVVPLIGELDGERLSEIVEDLLAAAVSERTRTIILDLTGVPELDTRSVDALIRATRALRLIGVRALLTGLSPAIAQSIAQDWADYGDLEVYANLQTAIRSISRK
ncbi:MAG: STAS domain-containing protein [Enhygromyxa sp.]